MTKQLKCATSIFILSLFSIYPPQSFSNCIPCQYLNETRCKADNLGTAARPFITDNCQKWCNTYCRKSPYEGVGKCAQSNPVVNQNGELLGHYFGCWYNEEV